MRSLQLFLRTQWNFLDDTQIIWWDASSQEDLLWWCEEDRLEEGVSLESCHPDLMFWSDVSDQCWGVTACDQVASGYWGVDEVGFFINVRELLVIEKGLHAFFPFLKGQLVAVFCNNTMALSHIRHQRGHSVAEVESDCSAPSSLGGITGDHTPSPVCHGEVQCSGGLPLEAQSDRWVQVDASPSGVRISTEAVVGDGGLICHLTKSPLTCLFCSDVGSHGSGHRRHVAELGSSAGVCLSPGGHVTSGSQQDQGFCGGSGHSDSSILAVKGVVPGPPVSVDRASSPFATAVGSASSISCSEVPPVPVVASSSCVETLQRFAGAAGTSS